MNYKQLILSKYSLDMPDPEVGKVYNAFDDGKLSPSRLMQWRILEEIDLNNPSLPKQEFENLVNALQEEIDYFNWLYAPEQTVIYRAQALDKDGSDDLYIGDCYFLRTNKGGWFGACSDWCSELDVDGRLVDIMNNVLLGD